MGRQPKVNPEYFVDYADQGISNVQIGSLFGVSEATVRRGLAKLGYIKGDYLLPSDEYEAREEPLRLFGDAIVAADFHIPLQSNLWCNRIITTAMDTGIGTLIIAGDYFNMDSLSVFEPKQSNANLRREVEEAKKVLETFLKTFSSIYIIPGNHDLRIIKALQWRTEFTDLVGYMFGSLGDEFISKVTLSNLSYLWLGDEEILWYICHPLNFSATPLAVPRKLANIHNSNIIGAHGHHCAVGYAEDGKKVIVESGGAFDKNKIDYIRKPTTSAEWTNGYCYIVDGKAKVISDGWST